MQTVELAILDWIQTHVRCGFLDGLMPAVSRVNNGGEVWILLAVVLFCIRKTRSTGLAAGGALALNLAVTNWTLKPLIGRIRPFAVNSAIELLVSPPSSASFPSGHTASSFAVVFALWEMKNPLWKPACVLAALIAFSRMYLYVHWPTDILGGIAVGAAAGITAAKIVKKLWKRK